MMKSSKPAKNVIEYKWKIKEGLCGMYHVDITKHDNKTGITSRRDIAVHGSKLPRTLESFVAQYHI